MLRSIDYRGLLISTASALALCIAAPAALAQAGPTAETGRDVVTITGQTIEETLPQELQKYGSDLEVVDSTEIRNQLFVDAQQALQMKVPGLFVASRGGPFSYMDISLQGSRNSDMLLLVDGVRINNRLYSGTMSDTLPASMIERIEVLKGGQGLFYGTQAAAGVINFVTRGYTDDFNGMVTVGGDTNDSIGVDGYVRGKAGPGNYVLYASQNKTDGYDLYDARQPSSTDLDRSSDIWSAGGKYRIELTENLAIDARYQHTDARLDNTNPTLVAYSKNERDEDIASLGVDFRANDWAQFLVKGYWHDWDSTYTTIRNTVTPGTGVITGQTFSDLNTYWGFEDKGINALAKLTPGGPFEYVVGYDFQQYSGKDDVLLIAEQEEEVNAFFGQVRSDELIQNASFAIGVRHNEASSSSKTIWNASARYDFMPGLYAQTNFGTSFLLPTAEQLYAIDPFSTLGNPNLEAEEADNFNIGFGGEFNAGPSFAWQATYFSRDIDNRIQFADCDDSDPSTDCAILYPDLDPSYYNEGFYVNLPGTVEVRGFELSGTADFGNGFTAIASYTDSTSEDAAGVQLARVPRTYGKVGASYEADQWGVDGNLLWVGEVNSTNLPGGFGVQNYGDYMVVDIAAHMFLDADHKHKITARVENLFDEEYRTALGVGTVDGTAAPTLQRFLVGTLGVPQTLHVSYSYGF
ncbi:MAG TPA: TonB-dependent receptor [Hyphomonadaceae bacterium]|nr:TonB-dependent receptor [Hyphomonadaceae bacterium]